VPDENDHGVQVDAWMARVARDTAPEKLFEAFEQGFGAIWRRAHATLGEVTLMAILERVLYTAGERFPVLLTLEVDSTGLRSDKFRERVGSLQVEQLAEVVRFILLEFLTVLGNLTAEVLSPALHAELAKVPSKTAVAGEEAGS
jgi:hypothetical protein